VPEGLESIMTLSAQRAIVGINTNRVLAWSGVLVMHAVVIGAMLLPRVPVSFVLPSSAEDYIPIVDFDPPPPPPTRPPPPIEVPPPPIKMMPVIPPPVFVPPDAPLVEALTITSTNTIATISDPVPITSSTTDSTALLTGPSTGELLKLALLQAPPPIYPRRERTHGISGNVELRVLVGIDGLAQEVHVIGGSRNRAFELAAIRSVKRWRFQPHTIDGVASRAWARVPVAFRMDD